VIAVDTNILVFAHREERPAHIRALQWIRHLATRAVPWALPVFALGEFVRVVTHPRVFDPPSSLEDALAALHALVESPGVRILNPGRRFPTHYSESVRVARASGNLAFDAQIAALCREHGVGRLLTRDRDFSRFPWIQIVDLEDAPADFA